MDILSFIQFVSERNFPRKVYNIKNNILYSTIDFVAGHNAYATHKSWQSEYLATVDLFCLDVWELKSTS